METYDLAIVGAGFAGYTAAIYASRYGLKNVIFGDTFGGQTVEAHKIGNYPGFEEITGTELMQKIQSQAKGYGTTEVFERITDIKKDEHGSFVLTQQSGAQVQAQSVLLAIGIKRRKLHIPGEDRLYGKGVTYCATCDGFFYKGKIVAVVGGGDSAVTSALYLADICPKVYMIVRKGMLKAENFWLNKLKEHSNIEVIFNANCVEFVGEEHLEKIYLDVEPRQLAVDGVFIEIGHEPNKEFTDLLGVKTDDAGYIVVDHEQQTSIPGMYAAGDSTAGSNRFAQLVTAASEAAIAVADIAAKREVQK